jgi:hypothetical protein
MARCGAPSEGSAKVPPGRSERHNLAEFSAKSALPPRGPLAKVCGDYSAAAADGKAVASQPEVKFWLEALSI